MMQNNDHHVPKKEMNRKEKRQEFMNRLKFVGNLDPPYSRIRAWKNVRGVLMYDCECEQRKPIHDLGKIKHHLLLHDKKHFECNVCGKIFHHYLGLNGHMRTHSKSNNL